MEFDDPGSPPGLPLDYPAPEFELQDLAGEEKEAGRVSRPAVLLFFFNPACGYCRDLAPRLSTLTRPADTLSHSMGEGRGEASPLVLIVTKGDAGMNRNWNW